MQYPRNFCLELLTEYRQTQNNPSRTYNVQKAVSERFLMLNFQVRNLVLTTDMFIPFQTPLMTLSGHTEAISSVLWMDHNTLCSSGWDHSIRVWDLSAGVNKQTMVRDYFSFNDLLSYIEFSFFFLLFTPPRKNPQTLLSLSMHSQSST